MQASELRKLVVDTVEKQLAVEGYELINRATPLPTVGVDEYKPVTAPAHRCALSVHVSVVCDDPLAATLSITRRLEGGEVEFEAPITVRPVEAEARVRAAIAVAIAKAGEVSLSRVLSLLPVQDALLRQLGARDTAKLMYANRAVRAALSTKNVDVTYWKAKFTRDFPDETVEDASSPSAYRRLYGCHAMRALEEKRNRKRANRPRMIDSPDLFDDLMQPGVLPRPSTTPPRPIRPHAPDPDMPVGPLGRDPNMPDFPGFNPLYDNQPHNPLAVNPRRPDPRNPFAPGYGYDVMPNRPGAPRGPGGFPHFHGNNDYI